MTKNNKPKRTLKNLIHAGFLFPVLAIQGIILALITLLFHISKFILSTILNIYELFVRGYFKVFDWVYIIIEFVFDSIILAIGGELGAWLVSERKKKK